MVDKSESGCSAKLVLTIFSFYKFSTDELILFVGRDIGNHVTNQNITSRHVVVKVISIWFDRLVNWKIPISNGIWYLLGLLWILCVLYWATFSIVKSGWIGLLVYDSDLGRLIEGSKLRRFWSFTWKSKLDAKASGWRANHENLLLNFVV